MKRGTLAFLGRKDHSLFDTSIKMREMDHVELVLNSPTSPESGTASVRARPTVKHYTTSESFQAFAVPTPKVPILPPISGSKVNSAVNGDVFSYDLAEEEIIVPPPPPMAPPPPPETFILPPPDFMGYLSSLEMAALQPPSTSPPKPPIKKDKSRRVIKPPTEAPPEPPSMDSSETLISKPSPAKVPKHPKFAPPPPPPTKEQPKTAKIPPPKPIRLSSMANTDSPPHIPAPSPPVKTRTQSTFNPQNSAKLNHVSNTSILKGYVEQDTRPKQMLLLEDTGPASPMPKLVQVNGNVPRETPTKPIRKDPQHQSQTPRHEPPKSIPNDVLYYNLENLQNTLPAQSSVPEVTTQANAVTVSAQNEMVKPRGVPYKIPRKLQTWNKTVLTSEDIQGKLNPKPDGKFSPSLAHKRYSLKNDETIAAQETSSASPLSLLMAAKERDKSKSYEIATMKINQRRGGTHNSIAQTLPTMSRSLSSSALFHPDEVQDSPTSDSPVQYWDTKSATIARKTTGQTYNSPEPTSSDMRKRLVERNDSYVRSGGDKVRFFLPPPPEFEDFGNITEPSPSIRSPDPLLKMAPQTNRNSLPPAHVPPSPVPKPSKQPSLNVNVQPKPQFQTYSTVNSAQQPTSLSPSQTTLVSILQKKMLEMDHKITPTDETDYDAQDWSVPLSEEVKVPVIPKTTPQVKIASTGTNQTTTHKQEVKMVSKLPVINSNERHSSYQYGMTYRIRPGTQQPITLIRKGPS
ncbi:uncharacterized protein ACBT44_016146 isoform 1-T1 [Syngnathus typhle]